MVAGPLMALVPMATLAAILLVVAWNMAEKREFMALAAASKGDAVVLFAAFWLTVLVDLTVGIGVGIVLGALLFMHRMAEAIEIKTDMRLVDEDISDTATARVPYDNARAGDREVVTYRLSGAFFFGAAATVAAVLDGLGATPKVFILDLSGVPFLDATGAYTLENFVRKLSSAGTAVIISGARPPVRKMLDHFHVTEDKARFTETADEAASLAAQLRLLSKDGR
jgi:SulP family sulfate permease